MKKIWLYVKKEWLTIKKQWISILLFYVLGTLFNWAYECRYLWLLTIIAIVLYLIGLYQGCKDNE